mgnify:CR=1 FL=1
MNNKKKYIVYTPEYDENNGGAIVLHKLCSILNDLGNEAYIYPFKICLPKKDDNGYQIYFRRIIKYFKLKLKKTVTNDSFNTPIFPKKSLKIDSSFIVIYPEIVDGNPLNAKNVIRWLLHRPGFFSGKINYSKGELYFRYQKGLVSEFHFKDSFTSDLFLKVIHFPRNLYNNKDLAKVRTGSAYSIRKGKGKKFQHDLVGSILIDGKSHEEISQIFKRVKVFISYDTQTAYSRLAALCECESIIIPDEGQSKNDWKPLIKQRYGLSFGFDDYYTNNSSQYDLLLTQILLEENESESNVKKFVVESQQYFI